MSRSRSLVVALAILLAAPVLGGEPEDFKAISDLVQGLRGSANLEADQRTVVANCEAYMKAYPDGTNLKTVRNYYSQLAYAADKGDAAVEMVQKLIKATDDPRELIGLYKLLQNAAKGKVTELKNEIFAPGRPAPTFSLPDIHGDGAIALEDLRGKTVLVDFWATWCGPCVNLMQNELSPLWAEYKDKDFVILGVGTNWRGDTAAKQLDFAGKTGYGWPKVFDATGATTEEYMVEGIPFCVLIDAEGDIVVAGNGGAIMPQVKEYLSSH